jgi:hypothetical protein
MNASTRSTLKSLLRGVAGLLFITGAGLFWVGGRAINAFTKTPRGLAEIEGIGLAVVCFALGALIKRAGDDSDEANGTHSSTSAGN